MTKEQLQRASEILRKKYQDSSGFREAVQTQENVTIQLVPQGVKHAQEVQEDHTEDQD